MDRRFILFYEFIPTFDILSKKTNEWEKYMINHLMSSSSNPVLERYQNKIIFFCVSFFALHWIFFISVHTINVPYNMEFLAIELVYNFVEHQTSLVQELFIPFNQHLFVFPYLVMFSNLYFNSYVISFTVA